MATIVTGSPGVLPNRGRSVVVLSQGKARSVKTAEGSEKKTTSADLNVGDELAGGKIINIDPMQGYRVRRDGGEEFYVSVQSETPPADLSQETRPES